MITPVDHPGPRRRLWIAATVGLLTGAVVSIAPAFMSVFLFDDPKSASDPVRDAIGYALMTLPLACFLGAVLPWRFRTLPHAGWLFLLPLVNGAVVALWLLPFVHDFR